MMVRLWCGFGLASAESCFVNARVAGQSMNGTPDGFQGMKFTMKNLSAVLNGSPAGAYGFRGLAAVCVLSSSAVLFAQMSQSVSGTVADPKGSAIAKANVSVKNDADGQIMTTTTDASGHFSAANLAPGVYTVQAIAPGFSQTLIKVQVAQDQPAVANLTLAVGGTTESITVEANSVGSTAAALAPMDALLNETSARTEITQAFIQNFTSPIADYGEILQMAPSTFTLSSDGIGLGQSKTYFRGFPDGDYDIDFDGIPFYDTNTPTHHSWAFFPSMFLGGVDFDRSPARRRRLDPLRLAVRFTCCHRISRRSRTCGRRSRADRSIRIYTTRSTTPVYSDLAANSTRRWMCTTCSRTDGRR